MKRYHLANNHTVYDGMELYCYGRDIAFNGRLSSFTVGKIYRVSIGPVDIPMIETDIGEQYFTSMAVLDYLSMYMLPLCTLSPKERFLFNLSGILPERLDEFVKDEITEMAN